jgi:DNA-binding transcriptional regulator PaaX
LLLYQIALGVSIMTMSGGRSARTVRKAVRRADDMSDSLFLALDPDQWQSAWQNLRRRGLINSIKGKQYEASITKRGLKKLEQEIPVYQEHRPWDKRIYLITYDIAEENKDLRNSLREYLKEIGCAQLQKSTYLTVYNPRGLLREWLGGKLRNGDILVSDLGPDGSLGDRPLTELTAEGYRLEKLNTEYAKFLEEFSRSDKANQLRKQQAFFCYSSILAHDPQLPFELLPDWWLGDKAYRLYRRIVGDVSSFASTGK